MARIRTALTIVGGLAAGMLSLVPAQAAITSTFTNVALTSTPVVASFGGGAGSVSFTAASTGYGPGTAVATGGNALLAGSVFGLGDYEGGTVFDGTATYVAYPTATPLQYSAADDFVGFSYIGSDGTHFGYAEVSGPTLIGYAVNSVAGGTITANTVVPEPATLALVLTGIAAFGVTRRRTRGAVHA